MKHFIFTYLFALFFSSLAAQEDSIWTAFWNKDTTLLGFKDKKGIVKIEPKFVTGFTSANRYHKIIAVMEDNNGSYRFYYLAKSGKIFGKDSLYIFDGNTDCESEGFIRFRDKKTQLAGMFNSNGRVVIPAEYNDLTKVMNGMVIALKGAEKKFWDKDEHSGCNHFSWVGGAHLLLDSNNNVLVQNFKHENNLNFLSLVISQAPHHDSTRINFPGTGGQYYSFVDFEKEFKQWLNTQLLNGLTRENLVNATFPKLTYWKDPQGWITVPAKDFLDRNFELIIKRLLELKTSDGDYTIFQEQLHSFTIDTELYQQYFTNCGESKEWHYPVQSIVITHKDKNNIIQDHLDFLRTENGYKLFSITIRKGKLK